MYRCLLHSLIRNSDDVRLLQAAGVLRNSHGSDQNVVDMFNYIGRYFTPVSFKMEFVVCKNKGNLLEGQV